MASITTENFRGWDQNACELPHYKIWKRNGYVEKWYTSRLSQTAVYKVTNKYM